LQIFRARLSTISECRGMAVRLCSFPQKEWRLPSRISLAPFLFSQRMSSDRFTDKINTFRIIKVETSFPSYTFSYNTILNR
jgi:hypothetical protein